VLGVIDPDDDPITINIDSIFQDEPVNGTGDGNTSPDASGIDTSSAEVRSERKAKGNGRFYHINFTATDDLGNSCRGTVLVVVSHDRGSRRLPVNDGPLFDSTFDARKP